MLVNGAFARISYNTKNQNALKLASVLFAFAAAVTTGVQLTPLDVPTWF